MVFSFNEVLESSISVCKFLKFDKNARSLKIKKISIIQKWDVEYHSLNVVVA